MASDKKCEVCKKTFSTTYNLKKHLENIHKQQVEFRSSVSQKCPLCTEMAGKKLEDLQTHIKEVHDIQMEEENINFENLEYFIQWKQNEEKESKAMFIKKRMTVERKDVKCTTYYCNRSGFFKSNSNGQRHIKVLGSNKINASCPARMKIKVFLNGRVELNYVKTHIGHTMDLARMRITEDERKLIANKLANNIPISDILDGVKTRADKMDKERIDLLKRRDVINIATCYNLKSKEIFANGKRRKKVDLSPRIECGELETGANECVVTMQEQEIASNFLAEDDCDDVIIFPDYAFTKLNNVNIGNTRIKRNSKSTKKSTANRRKMAEPTLEEQTEDLIIENYIVIETVEMLNLKCAYQTYEWGKIGSESEVANLLKNGNVEFEINPDQTYAELWMGTHPNGLSMVLGSQDSYLSLWDWIQENKNSLGDKVIQRFGIQLPFLFKVLSVNKALSIQAHPNKSHAEQLHEERPDIYKDSNHKPEMAIALSPFEALCGFRPVDEIVGFLHLIPEFLAVVGEDNATNLENGQKNALKNCFRAVMTCSEELVATKLQALAERFSIENENDECLARLFLRIYDQYRDDVGCFGIYFLNYIKLKPGEAMFLGPNEPHAYLQGDCVECMACSDNVVRAGLTPKFKDVDTLCNMLTYKTGSALDQLFQGNPLDKYSTLYSPPVPDFAIIKTYIPDGEVTKCQLRDLDSASIVLCVKGAADASVAPDQKSLWRRGSVVFIKASVLIDLNIKSGDLLLFRAFGNV